jgi:alcohol dehydrogenase
MDMFEMSIPTKLFIGPDALEKLPEVSGRLGRKALIVTTGGDMAKYGILDKVTGLLEKGGTAWAVFDAVTPNPKTTEIEEGTEAFRAVGCDFLIALGGGSSIDAAKNISMVTANNVSIYDYLPGGPRIGDADRKRLPVIAITTTAGTGSEVTRTAVVTNVRNHEKYGIRHECIYPTVSIVDPRLMLSIPAPVTAVTGIDAFYHAMEGYFSNKATPFSDLVAEKSMRLVVENLENAYRAGNDLTVRSNMAWAATLGGLALDNAICVGIHGLGQPAGGCVDAVHGKTLCAISRAYMRYTWKSDIKRYARVAEILGVIRAGTTEERMAETAGDVLSDYLGRLGLSLSLSDLGIKREMVPGLARSVLNTTRRTLECMKMEVGYDDIVRIYEMSL